MLALNSGSNNVRCKAAEQLATCAASSDENRRAGGCDTLVALVVNGSDDAKWHAARALRNLAQHDEAKDSILKADGIAALTPIAKHGKEKVKDAASEALQLLCLVGAQPKTAPVTDPKPAEPATTEIPTGEGTRVAMFSARFDGGVLSHLFHLEMHSYPSCCLMPD